MGALTLECKASNNYALVEGSSNIKVLVKVKASGDKTAKTRLPLNIALTIDRSTSMYEEKKLEFVKEAAYHMVDELKETDFLAVVDFGSDINVGIPAAIVTDKDGLKSTIGKLRPKGATNLYSALKIAAQEVQKHFSPDKVNRVLLLTDGEATEGVTEDDIICKAAEELWEAGISVSTLGVGLAYPEDFLAKISNMAGGNHYHIGSSEDCRKIFNEELSSLTSVVAKEVTLTLTSQIDGVMPRIVNKGYKLETNGREVRIRLDDIQRDKVSEIIFVLEIPGRPKGEEVIAKVGLTYDDTAGGTGRNVAEEEIKLEFTGQPALVRSGINREVLKIWEEIEAYAEVSDIVESVKKGEMEATEGSGKMKKIAETLIKVKSIKAGEIALLGKTILDKGGVDTELSKKTVVMAKKVHKGQKDTLV